MKQLTFWNQPEKKRGRPPKPRCTRCGATQLLCWCPSPEHCARCNSRRDFCECPGPFLSQSEAEQKHQVESPTRTASDPATRNVAPDFAAETTAATEEGHNDH